MPRYVVERTFDVDEEELPGVARRSKQIAGEQFPEIVWEHSHVVIDAMGNLKSFCVYGAPDPETIRRHGALLGSHSIDNIYEIGGDVSPADFPSEVPDLDVSTDMSAGVTGGAQTGPADMVIMKLADSSSPTP
jgi:hypothetical protein